MLIYLDPIHPRSACCERTVDRLCAANLRTDHAAQELPNIFKGA